MAASPRLKVFSPDGEYVAAFKYAEDAINFAICRGNGSEVRAGHAKKAVVWRVSNDDDWSGDGNNIIGPERLYDRVKLMRQDSKSYNYASLEKCSRS